jgi:hypothetical protein
MVKPFRKESLLRIQKHKITFSKAQVSKCYPTATLRQALGDKQSLEFKNRFDLFTHSYELLKKFSTDDYTCIVALAFGVIVTLSLPKGGFKRHCDFFKTP